ncbi:Sorting nexin, cytoplasm-to-vacuole targeting pathway/endosomal sorting [Coemansia interrupta]|uniref:Sorting nexin, cytoplasm-to-vacuole targeting pathway/endosomal sorting n=1 Tax=Coemansia interrupta TaxID=1126814 RepID=A0A9W8HA01_9FUNG|nr:Sorting nexin, cytoplasm-to-vacuole targeting pathway/endosomal sorting [Coemansia interrupta]
MNDFGDYCCAIDRHLHELLDDANSQRLNVEATAGEYQAPHLYHIVHINEAEKLSEGGSSFIAYSVQFGDYEVKRRYSEFESLRNCLCRLYPTFIVPPIPEKHSLTQYAVLQKRAKEDQYIIERRKRMLEHFLNHLAEHPILSSEHVFHRFLENGVSWTEVLHSPVITSLPKSPLHSSPSKAPGSSIADGTSLQLPKIAATNSFAGDVPIPSSALAPIRNVEARWMDCQLFTSKFANQFSGVIEKNQAKIYRKLGELSTDYAELGAALNGFSLLEYPESLAAAVERVGQAVDHSYIEINQLLGQMEAEVGEPMHEYSQYAVVIMQVLRFRLLKNLQMDGVQDALVRQRSKLEALMQADDEAKRLAQALESPARPAPAADAAGGQQRRYSVAEDAAEEDSLLGDEAQHAEQGFVTPQRANTDASSMHGVATGGRSRGPSVSSAMSAAYHGEFTPTLAPRSVLDEGPVSRSPARPSSYAGTQHLRADGRSRAGTGASIGSALGHGAVSVDGLEDDPLAQFQQEESQLWGGGARSTLPRLGAGRTRSRSRGPPQATEDASPRLGAQQQQQQQSPASMARSEYIGQAGGAGSSARQLRADQHMAASTPVLREGLDHGRPAAAFDSQDGPDDLLASGASSIIIPRPGPDGQKAFSSGSSFGVRLLRSPKALGDGIMSRLTYALNGMMDVDPEQLRRNQIGRASDKISLLEDQLEMLSNDLVLINTSTQDNLDRFQKQKVRELKGVLIATAKMHLEWAEKNLEIWKETKEIIDEV